MHPFFTDYLSELQAALNEVRAAIDDAPAGALDWSPREGVNSIAVLTAHIAGSTRYWLADVALQDPKPRDRDAEFRTQGLAAAQLKGLLDEAETHAQSAMGRRDNP